jgi:hypothetical protein
MHKNLCRPITSMPTMKASMRINWIGTKMANLDSFMPSLELIVWPKGPTPGGPTLFEDGYRWDVATNMLC